MSYRILIADTYYDAYLSEFYARRPMLQDASYQHQLDELLADRFSCSGVYARELRNLGHQADVVILNANPLQRRWAREHDLPAIGPGPKWHPEIFAAQVRDYRPDILFMQELSVAGDSVIHDVRQDVRWVVGQMACSIPNGRTFADYDLMVSSWKPMVTYFRGRGMPSTFFRLGFDADIRPDLARLEKSFDVTFVGGLSNVHQTRFHWLEHLCRNAAIDVFGYGLDTVPENSPIRDRHRGPAWGIDSFRVMARSKITLNCHGSIDVSGHPSEGHANNMRLFEATGSGTLLLTDWKDDLHELFEPGQEVAVYHDADDCLQQMKRLLDSESERRAVAAAGLDKTLRVHTYALRMSEFLDGVRELL